VERFAEGEEATDEDLSDERFFENSKDCEREFDPTRIFIAIRESKRNHENQLVGKRKSNGKV
jgi:hypothetical protein